MPQLKADGDIFFGLATPGDIKGTNGWSGSIGNDGVVNLTHGSGRSVVEWSNGDDAQTFLGIDNSLFLNPATSTIVPVSLSSTETITDFATASENATALPFTSEGFAYVVVPEPSHFALLLGLASLVVLTRRR